MSLNLEPETLNSLFASISMSVQGLGAQGMPEPIKINRNSNKHHSDSSNDNNNHKKTRANKGKKF